MSLDPNPAREPQIISEGHLLENRINELCDLTDTFEARLKSVLRQDPVDGSVKEAMMPMSTLVPLAESIRLERSRIEGLCVRYSRILETLEL